MFFFVFFKLSRGVLSLPQKSPLETALHHQESFGWVGKKNEFQTF